MTSIFNLTPMQVAVIGAIIGLAFALPLNVDEENVFGNVLDLAAEMVFIIAAQRALLKDVQTTAQTETSAGDIQRQIDDLKRKVAKRSAHLKRNATPPSLFKN